VILKQISRIYSKWIYGEKKMNNENKIRTTEEAIDIMIDLWVEQIIQGQQKSGDRGIDAWLKTAQDLDKNQLAANSINKFKGALRSIIISKIEAKAYWKDIRRGYLTVDYGMCLELAMACEESGVPKSRIPIKSSTWIEDDNSVTSRFGYQADFRTV
jgi:hypothetical protein